MLFFDDKLSTVFVKQHLKYAASLEMSDFCEIVEQSVAAGRQGLQECYSNLERVAAYCEAHYMQVMDKRDALEETKRYAVQSLASVAYQINTLVTNFMQALELQIEKIDNVEAEVGTLAQAVAIHKEKVARREIGVLTINKSMPRYHRIVAPVKSEKEQRYVRTPIDYGIFDNIGHGFKTCTGLISNSVSTLGRTPTIGSGGSSTNSIHFSSHISCNYSSPVAKLSTISKSSMKEYRTPVTISPPTAPTIEPYQMSYPGMVQIGRTNLNTGLRSDIDNSYQINRSLPATDYSGLSHNEGDNSNRPYSYSSVSIGNQHSAYGMEVLPPPSLSSTNFFMPDLTPSPPPIPPSDSRPYSINSTISETVHLRDSSSYHTDDSADWIPKNYLEKVVAIYDYFAEKPDELSFQENAIIYVLKKNEDGWFEGVMDGVTGLFPGNYVEPCY
ncbi:Abl interactor 2, partial [Trichinella patagoniensis]